MSVRTDTTIISSRATCDGCNWEDLGRSAPQSSVTHCEQTGHRVSLNTTSFTTIERDDA